MICDLILALLLWVSWAVPAQTQDPPKPTTPGAEAPHPQVKRIKMDPDVSKSLLKHTVPPDYPREARKQGIPG